MASRPSIPEKVPRKIPIYIPEMIPEKSLSAADGNNSLQEPSHNRAEAALPPSALQPARVRRKAEKFITWAVS